MAGAEIGFLASLLTTVALLIAAAIAGRRKRIAGHVAFVASAVASLGVAIYFALETGELYDLESAGIITPIHLNLARITTGFYLLPLATGPLAHTNRIDRRIHRALAWTAIALTVAATVTGVAMIANATRL
jgi:hypothetical protein